MGRWSKGYSKVGVWYKIVGKFSREFASEVIPLSDRGISITMNSLENFLKKLWVGRSNVIPHSKRGYGSPTVRLRLTASEVTAHFGRGYSSLRSANHFLT